MSCPHCESNRCHGECQEYTVGFSYELRAKIEQLRNVLNQPGRTPRVLPEASLSEVVDCAIHWLTQYESRGDELREQIESAQHSGDLWLISTEKAERERDEAFKVLRALSEYGAYEKGAAPELLATIIQVARKVLQP